MTLEPSTLLRVVIAGAILHERDFRLRRGEEGLSVFAESAGADAAMVVAAVRGSGKRGELAVAELRAEDVRRLGLVLVRTPVETGYPLVDACHYEARLSEEQLELLSRSALDPLRYFNEEIAPRLCQLARRIAFEGEREG
jgi:hypothetical protein